MNEFKKRIEDPTMNSSKIKEILSFLLLIIPAGLISIGAGNYQCMYLEEPKVILKDDLRNYGGFMSCWSILTIPAFYYMKVQIVEASAGVIQKAIRTLLRMTTLLLNTITLQIVMKVVFSILSLFVEYENDSLIVRSIKQVMTLIVFLIFVFYITFKTPKDNNMIASELVIESRGNNKSNDNSGDDFLMDDDERMDKGSTAVPRS